MYALYDYDVYLFVQNGAQFHFVVCYAKLNDKCAINYNRIMLFLLCEYQKIVKKKTEEWNGKKTKKSNVRNEMQRNKTKNESMIGCFGPIFEHNVFICCSIVCDLIINLIFFFLKFLYKVFPLDFSNFVTWSFFFYNFVGFSFVSLTKQKKKNYMSNP